MVLGDDMNFDYGNILTRAFQITWKHKVFWGILAIPMAISLAISPVMLLIFFFIEENQTSEINTLVIITFFILVFILAIFFTLLHIVGISAVTLGIVRVEQGNGSLKFMDLIKDSREYFWRQLGVYMIIQLSLGIIFAAFFAFMFVMSIVTIGLASICFQPIMLLLTPFMSLNFGVLEAAHTAVVTENLTAWDAVKRSFEIVRDHIWKYIILTVIVYIGVTLVSSFFVFPVFVPIMIIPIFIESGSGVLMGFSVVLTCIFVLVMSFVSVISQVFLKASLDVTYLRLTHKSENQVIFSETNA